MQRPRREVTEQRGEVSVTSNVGATISKAEQSSLTCNKWESCNFSNLIAQLKIYKDSML